jgi:hypothetical protein
MRKSKPMRSATLAALRSMFLLLLLASCGSSGTKQGDGNADAHADCGAIEILPPVVTVAYADTTSPVCDPTFTVVDWPDGGSMAPLDGMPYACGVTTDFGCPGAPADGGASPCAYALVGLARIQTSTYGLQVSQAGYAPAVLSVMSGVGGCVPAVDASHTTVTLHPLSDASTDGG